MQVHQAREKAFAKGLPSRMSRFGGKWAQRIQLEVPRDGTGEGDEQREAPIGTGEYCARDGRVDDAADGRQVANSGPSDAP